jgi:hypothetical protein
LPEAGSLIAPTVTGATALALLARICLVNRFLHPRFARNPIAKHQG